MVPALRRQLAEQNLQQRRLTGSVGAEDRDELAGGHGEIEMVPQQPISEGQPGAPEGHDRVLHRSASARRLAVSVCQLQVVGSRWQVSVTATIGTPARWAASRICLRPRSQSGR